MSWVAAESRGSTHPVRDVTGWIERVEDLVIHLATILVGTLIQYGLDRSPSAGARMANALNYRVKRLERSPAGDTVSLISPVYT